MYVSPTHPRTNAVGLVSTLRLHVMFCKFLS
jgi:hypothetical protein